MQKLKLYQKLLKAKKQNKLPQITVYNRIDGPGSSLDLRLFQQSFWKLNQDIKLQPRTIGITINVGTDIITEPLKPGKVGVESIDFGFCYIFDKGAVPPIKENWLLRVMEAFDLDGVKFIIKNIYPELKSAGLGGSAAVTTGVALLANRLSGNKLSKFQIIGMASLIEQDLGVSLTGTQEQSNAVFGGVTDYQWFPWGQPGQDNFYGTSIREKLLIAKDYPELRKRIDLYFVLQRLSTDVNSKWYEELGRIQGFKLHQRKCELAYKFKQGIKNKNWQALVEPIREYRKIRTKLCSHYMSEQAWEIEKMCSRNKAVSFPLGGGGGTIMVYSPDPRNLEKMRPRLSDKFKYIDYKILSRGHKFKNV